MCFEWHGEEGEPAMEQHMQRALCNPVQLVKGVNVMQSFEL